MRLLLTVFHSWTEPSIFIFTVCVFFDTAAVVHIFTRIMHCIKTLTLTYTKSRRIITSKACNSWPKRAYSYFFAKLLRRWIHTSRDANDCWFITLWRTTSLLPVLWWHLFLRLQMLVLTWSSKTRTSKRWLLILLLLFYWVSEWRYAFFLTKTNFIALCSTELSCWLRFNSPINSGCIRSGLFFFTRGTSVFRCSVRILVRTLHI